MEKSESVNRAIMNLTEGNSKMKKVIVSMIIMFILIVPFGGLWTVIFQPIIGGGGVDLSPIYPIYAGIILLTGLIIGCTIVILEEIRSLKK